MCWAGIPSDFGPRAELRQRLGYRPDERVCIVTVGGSSVGTHLIRRILQAWPEVHARMPDLRMVLVAGPRIDPVLLGVPAGVEAHAFVPDLDRHLAACDLALVQGGLTTCMELTAAGTPFLYFPLKNHFEQNVHVAHRLERYRRRTAHGIRVGDTGGDRRRHDRRAGAAGGLQAGRSRWRCARRQDAGRSLVIVNVYWFGF